MNNSLKEKRDEMAEKTANCRNGQCVSANITEWNRTHEGYLLGFDAAVKLMSEAAPEFDKSAFTKEFWSQLYSEIAAHRKHKFYCDDEWVFTKACEWQHQQLSALLAARDAEIVKLQDEYEKTYQAMCNRGDDRDKWRAMVEEMGKALKALADRHKWNDLLGDCICEQHNRAKEALAKLEEMKK